jgi:hypothetical protein
MCCNNLHFDEEEFALQTAIGFAILSYNQPDQLLRLTQRLTAMYDAPIVCHHNFDQCALSFHNFPAQVSVCRPHIVTKWGDVSCIHAALRALRQLYERSDPEWFVLLSGSDYPVAPAERVLHELRTGSFDAYIEHARLEAASKEAWVRNAYDRYVSFRFRIGRHRKFAIRSSWLSRHRTPFHDGFSCFAGDHWITGNRSVARILLNEVPPGLLSHLSGCYIPEECFYQTVLCNRPELRLSNDSKRYRDWSTKDCHPKTLGLEDIPAIQQSGAYFARKFDLNLHPETFDAFDRITSA